MDLQHKVDPDSEGGSAVELDERLQGAPMAPAGSAS